DVSKARSDVAILVNGEKVQGYTIPNDALGFSRLFHDLKQVVNPEIIFEATGIYSRRLEAFLKNNDFVYTRLNPLEAKKQLDSLRHRKTDKMDAENLAQTQFVLNRKPTYVQREIYEQLRDLSRFYQNLTDDIVKSKNRLHKVLQVTFPEIEMSLSSPTGEQYWSFVTFFPHPLFILESSREKLEEDIRQSTSKRISQHRVETLADKLIHLAESSYPAVNENSSIVEQVKYYAKDLVRLSQVRREILDTMVEKAKVLPEYEILLSIPGITETTATSIIGELGDLRRFKSSNQINAFIGIDLRHYESGNYLAQEHITKRGNPYARKILFKAIHNIFAVSRFTPCHIADFYKERKKQSPNASTKPYTIASMHRLIRTVHYLIVHNKSYDYSLAQSR
ncbi:IS110 family RNA-guided transposase, partial [Lactococcus garvieae]